LFRQFLILSNVFVNFLFFDNSDLDLIKYYYAITKFYLIVDNNTSKV